MNRTFQSRLTWHNLLLLLLLGGSLFYFLWVKNIVISLFAAALLILVLEQTIDTTYSITSDGTIIIRRGRFRHIVSLKASDIKRVTRMRTMRIGGVAMVGYVHIEYGNRYVSIFPAHEELFMELVKKLGIEIKEG